MFGQHGMSHVVLQCRKERHVFSITYYHIVLHIKRNTSNPFCPTSYVPVTPCLRAVRVLIIISRRFSYPHGQISTSYGTRYVFPDTRHLRNCVLRLMWLSAFVVPVNGTRNTRLENKTSPFFTFVFVSLQVQEETKQTDRWAESARDAQTETHRCSSLRSISSASIITTTDAALVWRRAEFDGTLWTCAPDRKGVGSTGPGRAFVACPVSVTCHCTWHVALKKAHACCCCTE